LSQRLTVANPLPGVGRASPAPTQTSHIEPKAGTATATPEALSEVFNIKLVDKQ